ncbi:hypothetical protein A2693_02105 [Candidatus Curtissbacteria bacterium RIFCSPHIGHO2_01_FULL_40_12]|uniref:Aminoglycoside phosphotransferase domain-containing protein n=2 Tax=Candidatus Curtissiibacteriota TaxID=1752717 RepID=A0A1F5G9Y6_9BACT|nr:MAG: hypothetical protein A2693_02105 [Candidatus Curtissbacteria bacterium RIFCSPHIGHO2_01_FULL_40_12]
MLITRRHIDISLPNENIKLRPDLAKQVVAEARRLQSSFPADFLLSSSSRRAVKVNGHSVYFPYLSALFSRFLNEETALVFSIKNPFMFEKFIKEAVSCLPNEKIKLLLKYGIKTVQSTTTDIKLDGGSFSEVTLFLYKNKRWRIKKETNSNYNGDIDAGVRLREEAYFLTSLPKEARHLFPKVYGENSVSKSSRIGYEMEYFPYPTFAQLLFCGNLTAGMALRLLINIYGSLEKTLYSHKSHIKRDDDYFSRIDRRLERVFRTPSNSGTNLKKILNRTKITIGGFECEGFFPIYEKLRNDKSCRQLLTFPDYSLCHGDMILEDILINPLDGDFKLIDPNGQSFSKYYDFAKTFLSLSTYYEHFYFDLFDLNYKTDGNIDIRFFDDRAIAVYDNLSGLFWHYLREYSEFYFANDKLWRRRILFLTALQNIAIVMFHLIKHNNENRAIGFLLTGIKKLNEFYYEQKTK